MANRDERNRFARRADLVPDGSGLLDRAERALNRGEAGRALADVTKLLTRDSRHLGALEVLAKAQWATGQYADLQGTLDRLVTLNPYEPGYHALRGAVCQQLGRCGEAIRAYRRAVEQDRSWASRVSDAVRELESLQAGLIADLHREDPVFRAAYRRDPVAACRQRGFEVTASPARTWPTERPQPRIQARPS